MPCLPWVRRFLMLKRHMPALACNVRKAHTPASNNVHLQAQPLESHSQRTLFMGTLILRRLRRASWVINHEAGEIAPFVNGTLEWGVGIATFLSALSIVPRHCACLTHFLHPKLTTIHAVLLTPQLITLTLRRAGSVTNAVPPHPNLLPCRSAEV